MKKSAIFAISLLGILVIGLLGACRPMTEVDSPEIEEAVTPAVEPVDAPTAEATPAPTDTPEPAAEEAIAEEVPSVEELMAQVPTAAPEAIIPTPAVLQVDTGVSLGDPDAPITIVEFSDYQCPYCFSYATETYPRILENYVDAGLVRYVFKDFPLEQLHPQASQASEAAYCAGEQDSYWEMHDHLFANQERWSGQESPVSLFAELAAELGLDGEALSACVESGRYQATVQENLMEGQLLGVTGTPTFFVDGYPIVGARPYELFELAFALAQDGRLSDAFAQMPTPTPMPPEEISTSGAPVLGDADAPVLMIEYSDYQCPYCARYIEETYPQIKANYIDTGKVQYVFKDFPLSFHEQAQAAAEAAHCAGAQGDYWGMHDLLFANQSDWSNSSAPDAFRRYAEQLGLDVEAFDACLESGEFAALVQENLQEGLSVGVSGTPGFFVGSQFVSGAQPYSVFEEAIEAALGQ